MEPRRPIHGARYAPGAQPWIVEAISSGQLACFDYFEAKRFYRRVLHDMKGWNDLALMGANDRYFLLTVLCNRKDALHPWLYERCREVEADPCGHLDLWARYHYKDLWIETPVLTTKGWKRHGDLQPGDEVFSASGKPVRVVATKHFSDSACRRLTLDNGVEFICGAGHLWTVERHSRRRVKGTKNGRLGRERVTVETSELASGIGLYRPVIAATQALDLPHADLPIDPYVLGCWLGDGATATGRLTSGDQAIFTEIERLGYRVAPQTPSCPITRTIYGIQPTLRAIGVLGNKHIPDAYMLASREQRLALMQGLIDTDGHVSRANRCVTFAQKDKALSEQIVTLAASLGFKPRLSPVRSTGTWHVSFQESRADEPCRLARKLARLDDQPRRIGSRGWRVHGVMNIETVPTNCIQVDSDDGLYLVGRELVPTHNSTIITFAGSIQNIIQDPETTICIFSGTNKIAKPFLIQIKQELEVNEKLKQAYPDVFWDNPRKESLRWSLETGIVVKRVGNPKEATVEAYGLVDGMPTGKHYKRLKYDDLITQEHVTNPEMIQKVTERWELSDNLGVGEGTEIETVGTRYSFADTYGIMIERGVLIPRLYPATDNGKLNGKPVFLSPAHWERVKNKQRSTAAAQMLQNPTAGKETVFMPQWLASWEVRPSNLSVYIMVDPSGGRTRKSDRTAIAVVGIDGRGNKFLLDGYRHRMTLSERWAAVKGLWRKWSNERGIVHVAVGYEKYGMQSDLEYFEEKMREEKVHFPVAELNWPREGDHSKRARVERLEPDVRQGRFYLPAVIYEPGKGDCYWHIDANTQNMLKPAARGLTKAMKAMVDTGHDHLISRPIRRRDEDGRPYDLTMCLIEELLFFPFAPHDDLVDATSRIFDMHIILPSVFEENEAMAINARDYPDA